MGEVRLSEKSGERNIGMIFGCRVIWMSFGYRDMECLAAVSGQKWPKAVR